MIFVMENTHLSTPFLPALGV
eukprot:COSAG01_NODE_56634_length_317_cov_0.701835_1_plen_20_part_01